MPLFEYDCRDCQKMVEVLVRSNETPTCPECASTKLEKRLSVPAPPVGGRSAPLATACQSSGPPCGPVCGRWQG